MRGKVPLLIKVSLLLAGGFLIGWVSYWSGFSKAIEIGQFVNQRHDLSQATEYDQLAAKLESGKVEEVRSYLEGLSGILKEQASLQGSETNSVLDLLLPKGGISLVRDYNVNRAKTKRQQLDH